MNEAFLIKDLSYKNYIVQTDKKTERHIFFRKMCHPHTNTISRGNHRIKDYPATTYWS